MYGRRGTPVMFWSILLGAWAMMRFWAYPASDLPFAEVLNTHSTTALSPSVHNPMIGVEPTLINSLSKPAQISRAQYAPVNRPTFILAFRQNYNNATAVAVTSELPAATSLPAAQMPLSADLSVPSAPSPEFLSTSTTIAARNSKRLDVYAYSFIRPGASQDGMLASVPQYGGGQSGIIAAYRLTNDSAPNIALLGRVSAAHSGTQPYEFAAGMRIKPLKSVPISLSVERRLRPGGKDVAAVYVAGSREDIRLPMQYSARGYAQAGFILGAQKDRFYDAGIRIDRPLLKGLGGQLHVGLGSWAGGQRGAGRLDIGPALRTEVKRGNIPLYLTADWRFRIAGSAAPGNGPAITLSSGF